MKKINLEDIIIVPKLSKFFYDQRRYHLKPDQLMARYKREGANAKVILESHLAQKKFLEELKQLVPKKNFLLRDKVSRYNLKKAKLVIAFGGDNHFLYLSQFITNQLLVGINSDPTRSEGALSSFTALEIPQFLKKIQQGDYQVEYWQRLRVRLNNRRLDTLATGDIFFGESERKMMSRYVLEFKGQREEQKSSGLIVSTGAGSTCWRDSAIRYLYSEGDSFPRTAKVAKFLTTEPYHGKLNGYSLLEGEIKEGEELVIHSLSNGKGRIIFDSLVEYPFYRGAKATISLSKQSLKVIAR